MEPPENAVRFAVIAALPREIAGLVRGTQADAALLRHGIHLHRMANAIVVAAGMGAARVTLGVEAALRDASSVETLISAGLAGACSPEILAGEIAEANLVIDAKTGERFAAGVPEGTPRTLVTAESIASVAEKARFAASYGAALVDMEAATVARLARARGLRFRAIKGVSDAHDFELESLRHFADARGHFRTGAFALHTALRPGAWGAAMRLGRDSKRALGKLESALRDAVRYP